VNRARTGLVIVALLAAGGSLVARRAPDRFDHPKHRELFPSCLSCHAGTIDSAAAVFPTSVSCTSCHDGEPLRRVDWTPREGPRASNLRFEHQTHPKVVECLSCHAEPGARWMTVAAAAPQPCFACHGVRADHLAQPDSTCAECHRPLAELPAVVTAAQVARFPAPASHRAPGFGAGGKHADAARDEGRSCSTCHAVEFCAQCHLDNATNGMTAVLGSDPRATAIRAVAKPASHTRADFERSHAAQARASGASCATCHAQPSCTSCHVTLPRVAATLATHDPRPGVDTIGRRPPPSHATPNWEAAHGPLASARPQNCSTCHARSECLDCHRSDAAQGSGSYHPTGFLVRHPAQAYGRETSCASCHNTQSFCQDCHAQSGVTASARLSGGFHDARQAFALGHGQAARQSLESCVSCHSERDCLSCHSATRGRGFDPHGPGFDAARLKRKNPGMCVACHAPGSV
jgi:hypothetical protein